MVCLAMLPSQTSAPDFSKLVLQQSGRCSGVNSVVQTNRTHILLEISPVDPGTGEGWEEAAVICCSLGSSPSFVQRTTLHRSVTWSSLGHLFLGEEQGLWENMAFVQISGLLLQT